MIPPHGAFLKAVILAGGEGTRLRPLTLRLPKPTAPIADRPLLAHQLDLLSRADIRELVFSLAYQPEKIQAVFGDGQAWGKKIHYAVESTPLGTGGAVKNAEPLLDDVTVVFNGDILIDLDLAAVIAEHKRRKAQATIVLTPVANPSAYGLVETEPDGRVLRFTEKPKDPSQIKTNNINAGIYILETATLGLMPPAVNYSIERGFFPALIARGDLVAAHVHRGYWIDIGTPEKYLQVHRDILSGAYPVALNATRGTAGAWTHPEARVDASARLVPPYYLGPGCQIAADATVGPGSVLVSGVQVGRGARVSDSVLWEGCSLGENATVEGALLANRVHVGGHGFVGTGTVLGEGSVVSDYSRT
jgi:NDP-sugar pyrophosphorylase family protein